jgi:hypothetical protein
MDEITQLVQTTNQLLDYFDVAIDLLGESRFASMNTVYSDIKDYMIYLREALPKLTKVVEAAANGLGSIDPYLFMCKLVNRISKICNRVRYINSNIISFNFSSESNVTSAAKAKMSYVLNRLLVAYKSFDEQSKLSLPMLIEQVMASQPPVTAETLNKHLSTIEELSAKYATYQLYVYELIYLYKLLIGQGVDAATIQMTKNMMLNMKNKLLHHYKPVITQPLAAHVPSNTFQSIIHTYRLVPTAHSVTKKELKPPYVVINEIQRQNMHYDLNKVLDFQLNSKYEGISVKNVKALESIKQYIHPKAENNSIQLALPSASSASKQQRVSVYKTIDGQSYTSLVQWSPQTDAYEIPRARVEQLLVKRSPKASSEPITAYNALFNDKFMTLSQLIRIDLTKPHESKRNMATEDMTHVHEVIYKILSAYEDQPASSFQTDLISGKHEEMILATIIEALGGVARSRAHPTGKYDISDVTDGTVRSLLMPMLSIYKISKAASAVYSIVIQWKAYIEVLVSGSSSDESTVILTIKDIRSIYDLAKVVLSQGLGVDTFVANINGLSTAGRIKP